MGRKTIAQRAQERDEAQRRAFSYFLPDLRAVKDFESAAELVASTPPVDSPGRKYYSNFAYFFQWWSPPDGASVTELREYIRIVRALGEAGALETKKAEDSAQRLEIAVENRGRRF